MTDQTKDPNKPISSGLQPGPGEHLADAQPSIAANTSGSNIDSTRRMTGSADIDGTALSSTDESDQNADMSEFPGADRQGSDRSRSSPRDNGKYDAEMMRSHDESFGGQQHEKGSSTDQGTQNLSRVSLGVFLASSVAAGFLFVRLLKNASGQSSGNAYRTDAGDISGAHYGVDALLDSERMYGVETAYAPETSYESDASDRSDTFSSGTADRVTDRVKQASQNARTKLQESAAGAKASLSDVGQRSKTQYYRAKDRIDTAAEEQPLLIGVLGIVLGAGLAAIANSTRQENALMGGMRDNLLGKAKETAMNRVQAIKEHAQEVTDTVKQEAKHKKDDLTGALEQSGSQQSGNQQSAKSTYKVDPQNPPL